MGRRAGVLVMLAFACGLNADEPPLVKEPQLRLELIRRAKADQDVRGVIAKAMLRAGNGEGNDEATFEDATHKAEFNKLTENLRRTDTENTQRLGEIVEQHGWPTYTLVGKDGAQSAWLLVQHADLSPKFQRQCLDLMAKVPRDEISQQNVAYLTDRVLLAEGKKQLYGTQFTLINGAWSARPLEDESNVDKRRAAVGLPPLADYVKDIEAVYGGGSRK